MSLLTFPAAIWFSVRFGKASSYSFQDSWGLKMTRFKIIKQEKYPKSKNETINE
jgi:hypothetical protein